MKKILSITLLLGIVAMFTACKSEEDDLFDSSAAQRLDVSKTTYTQRLPQATAGWAMEFYPTNSDSWPRGNGYLLLAQFNKDLSVRMAMQNEEMSDGLYLEDTSLWEVIADQGPVLSFNSYNKCLHSFADPAIYETGLGLEGDYEFEIINLEDNAEFATLKGKKRGSYVRMTRLDEGTDFQEYLADVTNLNKKLFNPNAPNNLIFIFGDMKYIINDVANGFLNLYPEDGDAISESESYPYLITRRGSDYYLRFRDAFDRDDMEGTLQELCYDSIQDKFIGTDNPNFQITGYYQGRFLKEKIASGSKFHVTAGTEVSELFNTYMTDIAESFAQIKDSKDRKKRSYSFVGLNFSFDKKTQQYVWNVIFRVPSSSANSTASYAFEVSFSDDDVTMRYIEPLDESSTNISNTITKIAELMALLTQEYTISAALTNFDLSKLKLTSKTNPDLWFILNINK